MRELARTPDGGRSSTLRAPARGTWRPLLPSPARSDHPLEARTAGHVPKVDAFQRRAGEQDRSRERQHRRPHDDRADPDQVRLHEEGFLGVGHGLDADLGSRPEGLGAAGRFGGRLQAHLLLELLEQLGSADLLRLLLDLDALGIDVGEGHVHARLVDGVLLLDLLQHPVMGRSDACALEAPHRVGDLALPLRPPRVAQGLHGLGGLAVLLAHEGLLDLQGLVECLPRPEQLLLVAQERRFHRLELRRVGGRDMVAPRLQRRLHLGGQLDGVVLVLLVLLLEQRDVRLHHRDRFVHLRDLIVQVANVLLEDELGILGGGYHPAEDRAKSTLHSLPHERNPRDGLCRKARDSKHGFPWLARTRALSIRPLWRMVARFLPKHFPTGEPPSGATRRSNWKSGPGADTSPSITPPTIPPSTSSASRRGGPIASSSGSVRGSAGLPTSPCCKATRSSFFPASSRLARFRRCTCNFPIRGGRSAIATGGWSTWSW